MPIAHEIVDSSFSYAYLMMICALAQKKGGNPLGCGWKFDSPAGVGSGMIRALSCTGTMANYCLSYDPELLQQPGGGFALMPCKSEGARGWQRYNASGSS